MTREVTPGRTYQLAGILHCGLCGRRMDSHWTHQRPGYRCRHGHNSSTTPEPGQPRNTYVREDQILAHLPALVLRLTTAAGDAAGEPPTVLDAVEYVRAGGITLTYDAASKTLTADTERAERIMIG